MRPERKIVLKDEEPELYQEILNAIRANKQAIEIGNVSWLIEEFVSEPAGQAVLTRQ